MTNLWHDVPLGDNAPNEFNTIIEIPKHSSNKYEIDKATGLIKLDRANYGAAPYPFDYGFAPQTLWEDDDALDVIVLTTYPLDVGILVAVRPVGLIKMVDGGDNDDKIIAVPVEDRRWDDVNDLADINSHDLQVFQDFLENYKNLKKSDGSAKGVVQINGFENAAAARAAVEKSVTLYAEKFGNN